MIASFKFIQKLWILHEKFKEKIKENCKDKDNDEQISIADLTGVAVQDIQIAKAILDNID